MGSAATQHTPYHYYGIKHRGLYDLRRAICELHGSGHSKKLTIVIAHTVGLERGYSTIGQSSRDMAVPLGGDYGHACALYVRDR